MGFSFDYTEMAEMLFDGLFDLGLRPVSANRDTITFGLKIKIKEEI